MSYEFFESSSNARFRGHNVGSCLELTGSQSVARIVTIHETAQLFERLADEAIDAPQVLDELMALARPRLLRLVHLRMPDGLHRRVGAEDIVQETLATAAGQFEKFAESRKVPVFVWLRGLAIDRLIDAIRKHMQAEKRTIEREESPQEWLSKSNLQLAELWLSQTRSPSEIVSDKQRAEDLQRAISELSDRYREIVFLRFFEALSLEETAAAIGCSVNNTKVLQFRALRKLEKLMVEKIGWKTADRKR
ncbi:MAG: sigma-70 family RNA polymerase sigma factor [Planctomycetota bacterium]